MVSSLMIGFEFRVFCFGLCKKGSGVFTSPNSKRENRNSELTLNLTKVTT